MTTQTDDEKRTATQRRIREIDAQIDDLESEIAELEDEKERLERGIAQPEEQLPDLPQVMEVEVDGVTWFTDGYRVVRGSWPGEYERREHAPSPDLMRNMLGDLGVGSRPVGIKEIGRLEHDGYEVAVLSNGMVLQWDWLQEILPAAKTLHSDGKFNAVVLRDAEGVLVAAQMPIRRMGPEPYPTVVGCRPYEPAK